MKKLVLSMTVVFCFIVISAVSGFAKEQAVCPVMGGKINKEIYVDHGGKRVYFCCAACIDPFKKAPGKYLKKMKDDGVVPAEAPKKAKKKTGHEGHNH